MSVPASSNQLGRVHTFTLNVHDDAKVNVTREAHAIKGSINYLGKTYVISLEYDVDISSFSTEKLLEKEIAKICGATVLYFSSPPKPEKTDLIEWGKNSWKRQYLGNTGALAIQEKKEDFSSLLIKKAKKCPALLPIITKIDQKAAKIFKSPIEEEELEEDLSFEANKAKN